MEYYKQEVIENEMKLEEMKKDTTKDQYDIKRYEQVLGESYMMVPDSTKRLQQAYDDLSEFLITNSQDGILNEQGEWYIQAKEILLKNVDTNSNSNDNTTTNEPQVTKVDDLVEGEAF